MIRDGLFTKWKFGFVFDPRLNDLQLLVLSFSTLYSSCLWRTDTVVFAKWNNLPLLNKPPPPPRLYWNPLKPFEIKNKPPGGILEDLRYWSWQRSLHKQGYSLIIIGSDAWRRNNGQRSFADTRLTNVQAGREQVKTCFLKFIRPGFWTDLNSCRQWLLFARHLISRKSSLCSQCIRNVTGTTQATNE